MNAEDEKQGFTVLVNGMAGTGKTWLTKELIRLYPGVFGRVGSTTWVSARLIGEDITTFYKVLRLNLKSIRDEKIHRNTKGNIIIDECSMLSRENLQNIRRKFPRLNILLVGDMRQLKPVTGTPVTPGDVDRVLTLTVQHRHTDPMLHRFIEGILSGKIPAECRAAIIKNKLTVYEAAARNLQCLVYHNGIPSLDGYFDNGREQYNGMTKKEKWTTGARLIASTRLELEATDSEGNPKFLYSPADAWWKNNTEAVVKEFSADRSLLVSETVSGKDFLINPGELDFWRLAEAKTVHKVQGQTIEGKIAINLNSIMYCKGGPDMLARLLYVAVSRVRENSNNYFIFGGGESQEADIAILDGMLSKLKPLESVFKPDFEGSNSDVLKEIEKIFCTGHGGGIAYSSMSEYDIAALCGVSHVAVHKRIKQGWTKKHVVDYYTNKETPVTDRYGGTAINAKEWINKAGETKRSFTVSMTGRGEFETVNPLIHDAETAKSDYAAFTGNLVFEFDGMGIGEQDSLTLPLFELGIINRRVYSGNKSIHSRITLGDVPKTVEEYKYAHSFFNRLYFGGKADKSINTPAHGTRRPWAVNNKTGRLQELLNLSESVLECTGENDWRRAYDRDMRLKELAEKNSPEKQAYRGNGRGDKMKAARTILAKYSFREGNRDNDLFLFVCGIKNISDSEQEALCLVMALVPRDEYLTDGLIREKVRRVWATYKK